MDDYIKCVSQATVRDFNEEILQEIYINSNICSKKWDVLKQECGFLLLQLPLLYLEAFFTILHLFDYVGNSNIKGYARQEQ